MDNAVRDYMPPATLDVPSHASGWLWLPARWLAAIGQRLRAWEQEMQQSGENASPMSSTDKIFLRVLHAPGCPPRCCRHAAGVASRSPPSDSTRPYSSRCDVLQPRKGRIAARQQLPRHCLPLPTFRRAPCACYSVRRSGRDRDLWALDLFDNP